MGKRIRGLAPISAALFTLLLCIKAHSQVRNSHQNEAGAVTVTLLHTNDLHSHLAPEKSIHQLGGVARLKTLVDQVRMQRSESYLLDAGDWSEGSIYYTQDAGAETLKLMDAIGYDATVVGNHDWVNGPEILISTLSTVRSRLLHLSCNLDTSKLREPLRSAFAQQILPHAVITRGKARIGLIGLSTYEIIYDEFFAPVVVLPPYERLRASVKALQELKVDAIVLLSHNSIAMNQGILESIGGIDLVIGAHDHIKLNKPFRVARAGAPEGWIVETGSWGRYLGQVQLRIYPGQNRRPVLDDYRLIALDRSINEDPKIRSEVKRIEGLIEKRMGPVFEKTIGHTDVHLGRKGLESRMGNIATDSYRSATGADVALDVINFIYGELHPGPIQVADLFNANPAVFNPRDQKTWTLHTLPMKGSTLQWLLGILLSTKRISQLGLLATSGLEAIFQPVRSHDGSTAGTIFDSSGESFVLDESDSRDPNIRRLVETIKIQGSPLNSRQVYRVAMNSGIVKTLQFIDSFFPGMVPLKGLKDTGIQAWHAMRDEVQKRGKLTEADAPIGGRLISLEPDVSILEDEIQVHAVQDTLTTAFVTVHAPIRNLGIRRLPPHSLRVQLSNNSLGNAFSGDPIWTEYGTSYWVSSLNRSETQWLDWKVQLPIDSFGIGHFSLQVEGAENETNPSNNQALRWFKVDPINRDKNP